MSVDQHGRDVLPSDEELVAASTRVRAFAGVTPLVTFPQLAKDCGARSVSLKLETLNIGGSFKIRGAFNAIALAVGTSGRDVVTYSTGNHGKAVTIAANQHGVDTTVLVPLDITPDKRAAMRQIGATLVEYDRFTQDRHHLATELSQRTGAILVPPYEDFRVIAGQATATIEILESRPTVELVVAPVGGGGLLAGTALAAKRFGTGPIEPAVIGIESEQAPAGSISLAAGRLLETPPPDTIADAMRKTRLGERAWQVIRGTVDSIETVVDSSILEAVAYLLLNCGIVAEPTSAVPVAWLLTRPLAVRARDVAVIVTGRNIDRRLLGHLPLDVGRRPVAETP